MKKVLKKMVGLLLATMMIGSILVGSVSAATWNGFTLERIIESYYRFSDFYYHVEPMVVK